MRRVWTSAARRSAVASRRVFSTYPTDRPLTNIDMFNAGYYFGAGALCSAVTFYCLSLAVYEAVNTPPPTGSV